MMNVQLHDALIQFGRFMVGRLVRGQRVEGAVLEMDFTGEPDRPLRYILMVEFAENPVSEDEPEEKRLLQRVFSEIPDHARIVTYDVNELRARLVGLKPCHEHEWLLADEYQPEKEND